MNRNSQPCEMTLDGHDTNGDEWNRCTVHDQLVLGDAPVCERYTPLRFETVAQIKAANKAAGRCWFAPETLQFFGSRVLEGVYGGRYFVTSELDFDRTDRRYTVREASDDGMVNSVSGFRQYVSAAQAIAAAKRAARTS